MATTEKPRTQREMLEQLWYAVIGTNSDGISDQMKELRKAFNDFMLNRAETCPVRKARMTRGQIITVVIALAAQIPPWIWIIAKGIR
jgi:hypothetical protein